MSAPDSGRIAALGLLAGLVAGLAMTLVMLVLRLLAGISPPLEMIPDRFAPTLTIEQFFGLIGQFGGYNELKQFGVSSVLTGQLVVSALLGLAYGLLARLSDSAHTTTARFPRHDRFLALAVALLWIVSLAILWPTLGSELHRAAAEHRRAGDGGRPAGRLRHLRIDPPCSLPRVGPTERIANAVLRAPSGWRHLAARCAGDRRRRHPWSGIAGRRAAALGSRRVRL